MSGWGWLGDAEVGPDRGEGTPGPAFGLPRAPDPWPPVASIYFPGPSKQWPFAVSCVSGEGGFRFLGLFKGLETEGWHLLTRSEPAGRGRGHVAGWPCHRLQGARGAGLLTTAVLCLHGRTDASVSSQLLSGKRPGLREGQCSPASHSQEAPGARPTFWGGVRNPSPSWHCREGQGTGPSGDHGPAEEGHKRQAGLSSKNLTPFQEEGELSSMPE